MSLRMRVGAIIDYLQEHYAGHLQATDIAEYLGIGEKILQHMIAGKAALTPEIIQALSRLCGVPLAWLEMGRLYPLAELGLTHLPLSFLSAWLSLGVLAHDRGLGVEQVAAYVAAQPPLRPQK